MCFSHLFLILNSSINILIYSLLSSKFREEVVKLAARLKCWGRRRRSRRQQLL
jgi:hypothetical protein